MRTKAYQMLLSGVAIFPLCAAAEEAALTAEDDLDTIIVTATTKEIDLQSAPASVSVVDQEELLLRAAPDLASALQGEAGVQISGVGQSRNGVSLRGMSTEHTLFLLDGRRVSSTNGVIAHTDFELSWLPAAIIEQIEVVRGPMSSLYGSDALGGVVNVITKAPGEEFEGAINLAGSIPSDAEGGFEGNANLYLSAPITDKLGVSFVGDYFNRDDLKSDLRPELSEVEGREALSGRANVVYKPTDNQRIDVIYSVTDESRGRDIYTRGRAPELVRNTDDVTMEQTVVSHSGDWAWGSSKLNVYRSSASRVNTRSNNTKSTRDQTVTDNTIDGYVNFALGEKHQITLGGQARAERLEDILVAEDGDQRAQHRAIFIQDEFQLTDQISLVGGFRGDHHNFYGWETSPRAYVVFEPMEGLVLKGGYGEGFKAPSLRDLSPDFNVLVGGAFFVVGNENLQPELSKTYEASISYDADRWTLQGGVFKNEVENLIQTSCIILCDRFFGRTVQFDNVDLAEIFGIEAAATVELPAGFSIEANYTYLDTEDATTGEELDNRARHSAFAALTWTGENDIKARVRAQYTGKQRAQARGPAQLLPDYTFVFAEVAYPVSDNLRIVAGVDNMFDVRLAEESPLFSVNIPGREFRMSLSYDF